METFDVHRRDILDFDNFMDLKKPGFGGPSSAKQLRDSKGNKVNKNPKLDGYQNTVERHELFSNSVYDPTYKAMSKDLVYKQEKKKPYEYGDPYLTGIPVVDMGDTKDMNENRALSFSDFVNEGKKAHSKECKCKGACKCKTKKSKKVNESEYEDELERLSNQYLGGGSDDESEEFDYESEFGANPSEEESEEMTGLGLENEEGSEEETDTFNFNDEESEEGSEEEMDNLGSDDEESEDDSEEETSDEWEKPEEEEDAPEFSTEREPSKKEIEEIERMLRGFEDEEEEDEDY